MTTAKHVPSREFASAHRALGQFIAPSRTLKKWLASMAFCDLGLGSAHTREPAQRVLKNVEATSSESMEQSGARDALLL
jgi:hypothetical protein